MRKLTKNITIKIVAFIIAAVIAGTGLPVGECSQEQSVVHSDSCDSKMVSHIVREGDTLYGIAKEYQVEVRDLMRSNNLESSLIRPGDILMIPDRSMVAGVLSRGDISREELMLLARIIHAEARGESFEGQIAVGAVILNRIASPFFPKTIRDVVYQKNSRVYQFSPVGDGTINLEPNDKAIQAAIQALSGQDPTGGALFFYNPDVATDQWIRTLPVITRIGNHVFASGHKN